MLILVGCAPISNAPLYEDERFLTGLPSAADHEMPASWTGARAGPGVLAAGGESARETAGWMHPIATMGEALRSAPPDAESDVHREWREVTVAASGGDGVAVWRVAARAVLAPDGVGEWGVDVLGDGGPVPIGSGTWSADGASMAWDLDAMAALGIARGSGVAGVTWTPGLPLPERLTEIARTEPNIEEIRALFGEGGFGWTGEFSVTDDGLMYPGGAIGLQTAEGGRARGRVLSGGVEIGFDTCWSAAGVETWIGGDPGIRRAGSESDCAVPELPEF